MPAPELTLKAIHTLALSSVLILLAACGTRAPRPDAAPSITIASWNIEHLAAAEGSGCRPRSDSDYAALRAHADALDADVIAFQEVESISAAQRVFTPERYDVVMSSRPASGRQSYCRRDATAGLMIRNQGVGIAIRKGIAFTRHADLDALALGDPDLRWGVDVTLRPTGADPLRVLALHLKSGCARGDQAEACPTLFDQVPVLQSWIAERQSEGIAFALVGDWNRRLTLPDDAVWRRLGEVSGDSLVAAAGARGATCKQRYPDFIDHIVLDSRAFRRMLADSFAEYTYGLPEDEHPSDHCPVSVRLR